MALSPPKVLLVGREGQLGWRLHRLLPALGTIHAIDRDEVDLSHPEGLRPVIRELAPQLIVNASAFTAVDQAEAESDLAMSVNASAPRILAEEADRLGALLIHYSTDYVFDGRKQEAYVETDPPNPLNSYGRSKWAGELAIQETCSRHLIIRTSWLYDTRGKNFFLTVLRLSREREELRVVCDQFGSPTRAKDLAEATRNVVFEWTHNRLDSRHGLYHLCNGGRTSWHGFAEAIVEAAGAHPESASLLRARRVLPIPSSEYISPALRPANSLLSCEKFRQNFGFSLPLWNESLAEAMAEMAAS